MTTYADLPKELKKVIDADRQKILETFEKRNTRMVIKKYTDMGKWDDVSTDKDGDIILWEQEIIPEHE